MLKIPRTVNDIMSAVPLYNCIGPHHVRFAEFYSKLCQAFQPDAVSELGIESIDSFERFYRRFYSNRMTADRIGMKVDLYFAEVLPASFGHYTAFQIVTISRHRLECMSIDEGDCQHKILTAIERDCIDAELIPVPNQGESIVDSVLF